MGHLPQILAEVAPVESFRSAPEFQHSEKRRLCFVQFKNMPLFWRVDLEILAQSLGRNREYDLDNEPVKGKDWSLTHSALMNAIAALKAVLRSQEEKAKQILDRGFERVGLEVPEAPVHELISGLAGQIAAIDPLQTELARQIQHLHGEIFGTEERQGKHMG